MKGKHTASKRASRGGVSAADKTNKAMMANANISNLKGIHNRREMGAVKVERHRQERNLFGIPSQRFHVGSSAFTTTAQCYPLKMDASFASSISSDASAGSGEVCSKTLGEEEVLTPYVPQTGVPSRLMLVKYVERSDGCLSPCPGHVIGDEVRSLDISPWDLSTESTNALFHENRSLSGLKISARDALNEESLRGLRHIGPQLTSLEVSRCTGISPQALGTLINGAAQLTHLDLSGCLTMGDEHIALVARECPSVTSVDLSSWLGLTDTGLAAAIRNGGFASLQRLLVSNCSAISDRGLREALDGCHDLKELYAGGCEGVTGRAFLDRELEGGVATAPVRGLRHLNLENCGRLDPSAVEWIAAGCTSLNSLVVSGCFPVAPEGIELLAATPSALSLLGVSGCVGIDGKALSFVAERGGDIQHLDISDIPATSAGVVANFLHNCGRLESVDLSGLPRVDSSSFRGLGRRVNRSEGVCLDSHFVAEPDSKEHPSNVIRGATAYVIVDGAELSCLRVARMFRLPNLDNDSVISFANACPHLENLYLSDSPLVTGACLVPLASLCPLLRSLELDRCGAATDETALAAALQGLPDLRHLGVAREHHSPVPGIPDYSIRDHGRSRGSDSRESIRCSVNDHIHTSSDRDVRMGAPMTGKTLLAAASRWCKQLTSLGLEGQECLTFLSDHAPPGAFPCLKELRLAACTAVDDAGLLVILEACPRVRTLSVEGSGISQNALLEASSQLSHVQVLPSPRADSLRANPKRTRKRGARSVSNQGDNSSTHLYPPSPPPRSTQPAPSGESSKKSSKSSPLISAGNRVRRNNNAVGLRPTMHCDLHLASAAVFSRFEEEDLAVNKVVRALRRFARQKFQERECSKMKLCRAIARYWFRTSKRHPDQVRLVDAKKAANAIKERVRSFHLRKRNKAAVGFQSIWRRYVTRCMFLHQQRLRYAARGMQRLWRGYYVRRRFRIREKVAELQATKRLIGVKWFNAAAAARVPSAIEAEHTQWAQMREKIQRTKAHVRRTLNRRRVVKEAEGTVTGGRDEAAGIFGTIPPPPHREIVQEGGFDVKLRATCLRDGRRVHFEGEARNAPCSPSSSRSALSENEEMALVEQKRPRDPPDFDVFRRATDYLLGEQEVEQKVLGAANRTRAEAGGSNDESDFEATLCGLCKKRFARVSCGDCRLGYCLRCLKLAHAKPERQGHTLHPFERPQKLNSSGTDDVSREGGGSSSAKGTGKGSMSKAEKEAATCRSLPDCAARAEAFLKKMSMLKEKGIIKVDEQRAKQFMKDRKEVEEMEAQAKEVAETYSRALAAEHNAARVVQELYGRYKMRVKGRREMKGRKRARMEESQLKLRNSAVRVQAFYRGYSVRAFLEREAEQEQSTSETEGGNVMPAAPSSSREKARATLATRVRWDCALRRRYEREGVIGEMARLEEELGRLFVDDVQWAMEEHYKPLEDRYGVVKTRRHDAKVVWTRLQEELSLLDPALPLDDPERKRAAKEIERQGIRLQHQSNQVQVAEKGLYWCKAFIRQHYRRNAAHLASKAGAEQTLTWLEKEMAVLNEVIAFASQRVRSVADVAEQEFFRTWLTEQITRAGKQRLRIDLEQEFVLDAERDRLAKAVEHASKSKGILQELLHVYDVDAHFMAERCGAELMATDAEAGTDEEVMWTSRIMCLKGKEEAMRDKLQHLLQDGLEDDIASEEKHLGELVKFTGDIADAPPSHFVKIKASLAEPPQHPQHLTFDSWKKVYIAQPWLAMQTQAVNKRRAARASTLEALEEMRAVVGTAKAQEALAAEEVEMLKNSIAVIEETLAFDRSTVAGEDRRNTSIEPLSDEDRKAKELEVKKAQEKIIHLEERLERRRKTNSHKEAELKLKEDALEADITAEEERHAKQVVAMAAFRATECDALASQYGKEDADAAINRMEKRLEKLKTLQMEIEVDLSATPGKKQQNAGLVRSMTGFVLCNDEVEDEKSPTQEVDYAEKAANIAKRAKLAVINKDIDELDKAKATIAMDYESADAQMMLAEEMINSAEEEDEAVVEAKRLQARVRAAIQRAKDSKEDSREQRRRLDEEEAKRIAAERKSKSEADIARRFAEKMGMGSIGKARGIMRGVERLKRKIVVDEITYGGGFVSEKAAIEAAIKAEHTTNLGKAQAVVGFAFTVGTEETDAMVYQQARQASQGLPHYRKIAKGLGGKDAVSLWVSKGLDSQEFFTELYITHADPNNRSYKNLRPNGYVPIGHPKLVAAGSGKPSILLWGKKDLHSDGIAEVELSYNEADEKRLSNVGFQVVPGFLSDCGLPDMRLWYSTVKRGAHTLPPVKDILHDLGEVRALREQNPTDLALIGTEARLESKLVQAREAEERKAEDANNPLRNAVEAYALTARDIEVFIEHFGAMDVERRGLIDVKTFFEYLEWPRNAFADHLFAFMGAVDEDGQVDFGDFVKLVCSYCMLGKVDLLKYAYTVYTGDKGFVSFNDLMNLLNDLHKTNPGPIQRALREADLDKTHELRFGDFMDLDRRFPKMFYPVANLQVEVQKKILGEAFWKRKMNLFQEARDNILKSADGLAKKARRARRRQEDLMYLKASSRRLLASTQERAKLATNRVREKLEKSKWMSKLFS